MEALKGNGIAKFTLTNFIDARVISVHDDDGNLEEGVFIPLDKNNLHKSPKGSVSAYAFVMKANFPSYDGWTHYLKLKVHPTFLAKLNDLGMAAPYLGNLKESNYIVYKNSYKDKFVKASDYGDE
jgi:hypothetical protein